MSPWQATLLLHAGPPAAARPCLRCGRRMCRIGWFASAVTKNKLDGRRARKGERGERKRGRMGPHYKNGRAKFARGKEGTKDQGRTESGSPLPEDCPAARSAHAACLSEAVAVKVRPTVITSANVGGLARLDRTPPSVTAVARSAHGGRAVVGTDRKFVLGGNGVLVLPPPPGVIIVRSEAESGKEVKQTCCSADGRRRRPSSQRFPLHSSKQVSQSVSQ